MAALPDAEIRPIEPGMAPKLAVMLGGSTDVNVSRARQSASVAVPAEAKAAPRRRAAARRPRREEAPAEPAREPRVRLLEPTEVAELVRKLPESVPAPDVDFSLFVQLERDLDDTSRAALVEKMAKLASRARVKQDAATVEIRGTKVEQLRRLSGVSYAEPGQPLLAPEPVVTEEAPQRPSLDLRRVTAESRRHNYGRDVLVGVIDVGGFDFDHEDFAAADGSGTRWVAIWDQGGTTRPSPAAGGPRNRRRERFAGLDYGSEIRKEYMDAAITAARSRGMAATTLEPQSTMTPRSHGTHVASISAGNRGVARRAQLAGVLVALRREDMEASSSFYDSTRIAAAVDYLIALAAELGGDDGPLPVSINISLGTNGHAHDTSSAMARWIDHALTVPGRCVSVAAGNAGQVEPTSADDYGYIMGRIHAAGSLAATNLRHELRWRVAGGQIADISENELEIWYSPQDRFDVEVQPPGGDWIGPIPPGDSIRNEALENGTVLSIYNETYVPANGVNRIAIVLSPFFGPAEDGTQTVGAIAGGEWHVRLTGTVVRDGRYDAWIERDDPYQLPVGDGRFWRFPSFFGEGSYTDDRMISSLACAERLIAVANVDAARNAAHVTSSRGPTRDGRFKPDIGADGTNVVAASGFDRAQPWIEMTGTSMASPYVCGVAALMLGIAPRLTSAQIIGIMRTTSVPLPGHDYAWRKDTGFGVIKAAECVEEAARYEAARQRAEP